MFGIFGRLKEENTLQDMRNHASGVCTSHGTDPSLVKRKGRPCQHENTFKYYC